VLKRIRFFSLLILLAACQASPAVVDLLPAPAGSSLAIHTATPFQPLTQTPILLPTQTATASPAPTDLPTITSTANPLPPRIALLFTGVIVPARCVQAAIDARGDAGYIYAEVSDLIGAADLSIGTLNTTLSDASTHTGCIFTYVLTSDARSAAAMANAGFDLLSVATNHIQDCAGSSCAGGGNLAFLDTLAVLRDNGILPVGAGLNHAEALQPVVVEVQGVRFGFVSLGMINEQVFAGEDTPGIAVLNADNLRAAIAATRATADVVIAMPHWGPEDSPNPNPDQLRLAQVAVEAGADLVVGNHTHVVQAIEQIDGVDVFYGLGNFVFDQTWDLAHQQGVILQVTFEGAQYAGYELIPTHVDGDGTVHLAGTAEAAQVLQRIEDASRNIRR
jgi:poly-gamma-glutamate capsule biosynthesis protein CapA/YwtB (metallophosphatase superfamily)